MLGTAGKVRTNSEATFSSTLTQQCWSINKQIWQSSLEQGYLLINRAAFSQIRLSSLEQGSLLTNRAVFSRTGQPSYKQGSVLSNRVAFLQTGQSSLEQESLLTNRAAFYQIRQSSLEQGSLLSNRAVFSQTDIQDGTRSNWPSLKHTYLIDHDEVADWLSGRFFHLHWYTLSNFFLQLVYGIIHMQFVGIFVHDSADQSYRGLGKSEDQSHRGLGESEGMDVKWESHENPCCEFALVIRLMMMMMIFPEKLSQLQNRCILQKTNHLC